MFSKISKLKLDNGLEYLNEWSSSFKISIQRALEQFIHLYITYKYVPVYIYVYIYAYTYYINNIILCVYIYHICIYIICTYILHKQYNFHVYIYVCIYIICIYILYTYIYYINNIFFMKTVLHILYYL